MSSKPVRKRPAPTEHFVIISGGVTQSTLIGVQNVLQRLLYERWKQR
jgi:hypothetical protein